MNVRFFGGTRAQYDSLATPRNERGLYFCADTRELFWGDRLLTDGTRIVPTEADLPSLSQAADGITYFVEETRNGYVISSNRTKWIQVIHAPTDVGAIKAISFAGIEMEEVDGVFTIDRRCAREALGFKVPEGMEDEEFEIASTDYVANAIANQVPVDELAKKEEVLEVKTTIKEEVLPKVEKVDEIEPTVSELKTWVENKEYLQDIDLEGYATEEFVTKKIAEAELADQDIDLSAYYTKSETEAAIKSAVDAIDVPDVSNLATKEELEAVQNVAGSNSVKLMQLDSDLVDINAKLETIPSIEGLATETYVDEKFAAINIPDISNFITMEEVEAKGYINEVPAEYVTAEELAAEGFLKEHQDLSHLAEKDHVHAEYAAKEHEHDQYLTEHQDLSEYAKKSDIPEDETFVIDFNAPDFAAALDAYNNGKLLLLTNAAPDTNSYAVMNYVRDDIITFTKFLMSRSSAYGSFNTYYLHNDNTWELAKEVKLNKVEANVSDEPVAELSTVRIGKEVYSIPSTEGLASIEYVDTAIAGIEIPTDYVTEEELNAKGYSKFSGSYNDLADKPEIPSVEGLASEEFVKSEIAAIDIPEADLTDYYTKAETAETIAVAIAEKADIVPFTIDKFVNNPIGLFKVGDNLNGLPIVEILAKLLELTDEPGENPDTPDEPEEPTTIPDKIIANNSTMYQVNELGEAIEIPYSYKEFTADEYAAAPTQDCFYQLKDAEGNILESGYQHMSKENDSMYYLILLPKDLDFNSNISVKCWDAVQNQWSNYQLEMSNDLAAIEEALAEAEIQLPEYDSEKYTLWIDSSLNTCSGIDYRFIINE